MMNHIDKIYRQLHWHSSFGEQLEGIKKARELEDLSLLILPNVNGESKSLWENCARALYEIEDERLEKHLSLLMEWLKDLNWPGAIIIRDRLKVFSGKKLKKPFIDSVVNAENQKDFYGCKWLANLSELLDNEELKVELPEEILGKLEKYYKNSEWWDED